MKSNNFKLLLLSSILLATSCNTASKDDSNVDSTPSTSVTDTNTESSSPVTTDTSSTEEQQENPKVKVSLNRTIYLRSEFDERTALGKPKLDYSEIKIWSDVIMDFKRQEGFPTITIPEGKGKLKAKLSIGKYTTYLDIQVYDTNEEAALANPVSAKELEAVNFKEKAYYNSSKNKTVQDSYYDEDFGKIMQAVGYQAGMSVNDNERMHATTYSWTSNVAYIFTSDDSNPNVSVLNPDKKCAPHEDIEHTISPDAALGFVHNVTKRSMSGTYVFQKDLSYTDPKYLDTANYADVSYVNEMILDSKGRICYLGITLIDKEYTHIALADLDDYYVDPFYQGNDYSTVEGAAANTNPAFEFGDNYDPNDDEKKYDFEKVIPEGGYHIISINNKYGYSASDGWNAIDALWDFASGFTAKVKDSKSYWIRESFAEDETHFNDKISATKLLYRDSDKESKAGITPTSTVSYNRSVVAYKEADTYAKFAYLYKLAVDSKNQELIAKHDAIVDALKYQQAESVKKETVLFDYYASITSDILDEWQAALIVNE